MQKIIVYTDGGSRGNPGPAAIGAWIETFGKKYSMCIGEKTNNEAEYRALIFALEKLKLLIGKKKTKEAQVECFLDSELVVKQLNHEDRVNERHIGELFLKVWNLALDFGAVEFHHIPREKNKIADKLVNEALDEECGKKALF